MRGMFRLKLHEKDMKRHEKDKKKRRKDKKKREKEVYYGKRGILRMFIVC